MKLAKLRQLLKDYEQTWYLRKYIYGDHPEAIIVRQYLKDFENLPNDYKLTVSDIFKLLKIIPTKSRLGLISSIKNSFSTNYLLVIFNTLNKAGLITESNFPVIYALRIEHRGLLFDLFCGLPPEPTILNPKVLETVLEIVSSRSFISTRDIERCIGFLKDKNLLTSTSLNFVKEKAKEAHNVYKIFQEFERTKCLNDACIGHLTQLESLYSIMNLFTFLNRAKIKLDEGLIKMLSKNRNLHYLEKLVPILIDSDYRLTVKSFTKLLNQDFKFFINKNDVFKLLQQNGLLDNETFTYVCKNDEFSFSQILDILSNESLLLTNKPLLNKLINGELDNFKFYKAIQYLQKTGLLEQKSLDLCVKEMLKKSNHLFTGDIFNLFDLLGDSHFNFNKDRLDFLFSLSESNVNRLVGMVSTLLVNNLLNIDSFEQALQRITEKLPPILESTAVKVSRKLTNLSRSEIILDNEKHFFTEHNSKYESGGYGIVKKGFNTLDSIEPSYGIKKLKQITPEKDQQEAIREVKYNHLFGRGAFYFSHKGYTKIVAEWQAEKSLSHFPVRELLQAPFEKRLRCLSAGLSDLNTLHSHYRVHGDVKCENYILDLKNSSMKLIDFGTAHKRGSSKTFAQTMAYNDLNTFTDHFSKDLYAMGIVTMHLFPEIYKVSIANGKTYSSVNKTNLTTSEQAIVKLVNSMMFADHFKRCTSEDALAYCNELINNLNHLDDNTLEKITNASINRSNITIEDVLRDTKRISPSST